MYRAASLRTTRDLAGYGPAKVSDRKRRSASRWLAAAATLSGWVVTTVAHSVGTATPTADSGLSKSEPGLVPPGIDAPPSAHFERVWHLGRVTGDLERIIAFYHDLLGLDLRGTRDQRLPFLTNSSLDEFVSAPEGAQFRAVHLPIPGASSISDPLLPEISWRGRVRERAWPMATR